MTLEHTAVKRNTRVRVKRQHVVTTNDKTSLNKSVNRYSELQLQIEEAQREQVNLLPEIYTRMKNCGVKEWATKKGSAERYTPASRNTTVIDKEAFRERVPDEDFMDSVKVSVTSAKRYLSGKELEAISEIIPGKKKAEEVRVKVFKPDE